MVLGEVDAVRRGGVVLRGVVVRLVVGVGLADVVAREAAVGSAVVVAAAVMPTSHPEVAVVADTSPTHRYDRVGRRLVI